MIKLIENQNLVKEIKENLISALTVFNCDKYIINKDEYDVAEYTDQDQGVRYILIRNDKDADWINKYVGKYLNDFYSTTYNTGTECSDKSLLLKRLCNSISPDLEIDDSTLWSFMIVLNRFANQIQITSHFWYLVMKLTMPQVFK